MSFSNKPERCDAVTSSKGGVTKYREYACSRTITNPIILLIFLKIVWRANPGLNLIILIHYRRLSELKSGDRGLGDLNLNPNEIKMGVENPSTVPDSMMNALINLGSYLPGEQTRIDCVDSRQDTRFDERPPRKLSARQIPVLSARQRDSFRLDAASIHFNLCRL
ncbi:hypothetical protein CEXT_640921 [Caerostris extrusa]|uniref:Uncharacterized protein n=1 Tax=Caerostris extrusa TaxID=172846 RepID=A0AAV4MWC3_CAEEX|nr:hypothetical protein CEXT_640921 [Caerostris extrusa]